MMVLTIVQSKGFQADKMHTLIHYKQYYNHNPFSHSIWTTYIHTRELIDKMDSSLYLTSSYTCIGAQWSSIQNKNDNF